MISFGKLKKKKECFLTLDIGTEAVKALVFEKDLPAGRQGNQKYSILGSSLQYFDESRPFDNDKVISRAKEEAVSSAGKRPKVLLLSFPPNILKSRVKIFHISRKNSEELISKGEAETINGLVLRGIEKEITERFAKSSGILPQEIQFTDNAILEIKIDGYEVPALLGYGGKNLEFKVLASFLPKGYLDSFSRVFNNFGLKSHKMANPIKNLTNMQGLTDGIFVDIGGEITQVCLIRNGKIEMIDEFELGGKDFSSVLSQTLGMRFQEARFFKERYSKKELRDETRQRVKEMMIIPLREWGLGLESKLKTIKGLMPSTFFFFGGGCLLPEIEELIRAQDKEMRFVYPKDFANIIDNTGCVNSPQFINSVLLSYAG